MQLLLTLRAALTLSACSDRHLRGAIENSPDGKTYFGVIDDNGGKCGSLKVDGVVWPHWMGKVFPLSEIVLTVATRAGRDGQNAGLPLKRLATCLC
jgi:hypothetical protein